MLESTLFLSIVNVCRADAHASQTIVCESFVEFVTTQFASGDLEAAHLVFENKFGIVGTS